MCFLNVDKQFFDILRFSEAVQISLCSSKIHSSLFVLHTVYITTVTMFTQYYLFCIAEVVKDICVFLYFFVVWLVSQCSIPNFPLFIRNFKPYFVVKQIRVEKKPDKFVLRLSQQAVNFCSFNFPYQLLQTIIQT